MCNELSIKCKNVRKKYALKQHDSDQVQDTPKLCLITKIIIKNTRELTALTALT